MKYLSLLLVATILVVPTFAEARLLGDLGISSSAHRPSRRIIRENARDPSVFKTTKPTIREVPLDRTFESREYGVKIQYSSRWERQDAPAPTPPLTLLTMFLSPQEQTGDIRQNVNLVVEELPTALTLQEYTDLGIEMERNFFDKYSMLSSQDIVVAGVYRAHRVIFSAKLSGATMTFAQVWIVRGKTAHVWTFADAAGEFEQHLPVFEKMLDTLTVQ